MLDKRFTSRDMALKRADYIFYRQKPATVCATKRHGPMSPGYCRICGESFNALTKIHAAKHGFKSREEMIAAGAVRYNGIYDG